MPVGLDYSGALNGLVILSSASLAITHHFDTRYQERHAKSKKELVTRFEEFSSIVDDGHIVHETRKKLHDNLTAASVPTLRFLGAILLVVLIATSFLMSAVHCDYVVAFYSGKWLQFSVSALAIVVCITLGIAAKYFWSIGQIIRRIEDATHELERDILVLSAIRHP